MLCRRANHGRVPVQQDKFADGKKRSHPAILTGSRQQDDCRLDHHGATTIRIFHWTTARPGTLITGACNKLSLSEGPQIYYGAMGSMTSQKARIAASVERTGTAFPNFPPLKETDKTFSLYLSQTSDSPRSILCQISLRQLPCRSISFRNTGSIFTFSDIVRFQCVFNCT